jgi:hypothetical protein
LKGTWRHFKDVLCTKFWRKRDIHRRLLKPSFKAISFERSETVELDSSIGKDLALHRNIQDIRE